MNKLLYVLLFITALQAAITSVTLETNVAILNVGEKATLTVTGTYNDSSTKTLISNIEWIVNPVDSVQIDNNTLTALKDTQVSVQAKVDNILSEVISLNITWTVNGHRLPPEPDPQVNNSTLLGIDSNDNGVRDDVERWIYEEYKDKHPIHVDIAMQAGRGWQKVLEDPSKAKEIHDLVRAPGSCQSYYMNYAKYFNEPILIKERIITKFFINTIIFNTRERERAFNQYDMLLSGDSYTLPKLQEKKALCDFNTSKYEE